MWFFLTDFFCGVACEYLKLSACGCTRNHSAVKEDYCSYFLIESVLFEQIILQHRKSTLPILFKNESDMLALYCFVSSDAAVKLAVIEAAGLRAAYAPPVTPDDP